MAKQVKIITTQHGCDLEKIINSYLDKGWKFKGDMVSHNFNLVATLHKN